MQNRKFCGSDMLNDQVHNVPMIYVAEKFETLTETERRIICSFLPTSRIEKAKQYIRVIDQNASLASGFLLQYGMAVGFGRKHLPVITYNPYGKPLFADCDLYFSISHCKEAVCCGISNRCIGIDVQDIICDYQGIMRMVMSEREAEKIAHAASPEAAFTRLWCLKESYFKYLGTGLQSNMQEVDFSEYEASFFRFRNCLFRTTQYDNYFLSTCTECGAPQITVRNISDYISEFQALPDCS